MTILKNKIEVLLNTLKNDISKHATNKKAVKDFFREGVERTKEVFADISKHRDPHHHQGMRFTDGDLLKAENAKRVRDIFQNPISEALLNPERKPDLMQELEKRQIEGFEAARERWVTIAQKNAAQTFGFVDDLMTAIRPHLYDLLNISSMEQLFKLPPH